MSIRPGRGSLIASSDRSPPAAPAASSPARTRDDVRRLNVEGAYPLFLIGSALLVYGVIVGLEVPPPTIGRFEIWQLVIVVGSTIVAAGLFSLYFAIDMARTSPPPAPAESIPPEPDRTRGRPLTAPSASSPTKYIAAPWWEGPPVAEPLVQTRTRPAPSVVSRAQKPAGPVARPSSSPIPERAAGPNPPPPRTQDEVADSLRELDAISLEIASTSVAKSRPPVKKPLARRCADCGRPASSAGPGPMCSHCGRALCAECAEGSLLRTADVTCASCQRSMPRGS